MTCQCEATLRQNTPNFCQIKPNFCQIKPNICLCNRYGDIVVVFIVYCVFFLLRCVASLERPQWRRRRRQCREREGEGENEEEVKNEGEEGRRRLLFIPCSNTTQALWISVYLIFSMTQCLSISVSRFQHFHPHPHPCPLIKKSIQFNFTACYTWSSIASSEWLPRLFKIRIYLSEIFSDILSYYSNSDL